MNRHAGQWALPGGRLDPGEDGDRRGVARADGGSGTRRRPTSVLGLLDDYPTRSGYVITPVVVWGGADPRFAHDPREVAEVHRIPLAALSRPKCRACARSRRAIARCSRSRLAVADVHAPTAAIVYQLREVVMRGLTTRVATSSNPSSPGAERVYCSRREIRLRRGRRLSREAFQVAKL